MLGVVGVVYSTVYAYVEYRTDQRDHYDELLQQVAEREVFLCYVWPLMFTKLADWEHQSTTGHVADTLGGLGASRRLYADLRRALLLTPVEYSEYKRLCKEAMHKRRTWMTATSVERKTEDICATYMWKSMPLDNLWSYLQRVYVA